MNALRRAAFLAGVILAGACQAPPETPSPAGPQWSHAFCPECWHFCDAEGPSAQGNSCGRCGKPTLGLETETLAWYECSRLPSWHTRQCEPGPCRAWFSRALAVPSESGGVFRLKYCPACRLFIGFDFSDGLDGLCRTCGRRPAFTDGIVKTWYWCRRGRSWREERCTSDRDSGCCSSRFGVVPAYLRVPPVLPVRFARLTRERGWIPAVTPMPPSPSFASHARGG